MCVYMWDLVHIVFSVSSETHHAGNSLSIFPGEIVGK